HPQEVHREEGQIEEHEGEPEVNLAQFLTHHAAKHLGKPVVDPGENPKDDPGHHVVNVRHNVVRIVDKDVHRGGGHKNAAQSPNRKQGHEAQSKQHGRGERIEPPHSVPNQLKVLMAEGTAIHMVVSMNAVPSIGFMPLWNMWWPHTTQDRKAMEIIEKTMAR